MTTEATDRIARLERQVEMLLARVETLETENAELKRRLGENSSNSSKPPSSDSPANRRDRPKDAPSGNPRGGQRGHKGHQKFVKVAFPVKGGARSAAAAAPVAGQREVALVEIREEAADGAPLRDVGGWSKADVTASSVTATLPGATSRFATTCLASRGLVSRGASSVARSASALAQTMRMTSMLHRL